ncbi:MAG: hypothetical protein IJQ39_14350 [Thermoguttaceae bacterium]|nr:hypothetical protein [Thermoguttaceae bacterium]
MKDIFEQLKAEGQRCQPEFSESLHARCKKAIDQIEANRAKPEIAVSSIPSRRSRVWQGVAAAVVFCVGFAMFNSFLPSTNTNTNPSTDNQTASTESQTFQPLDINPMAWEQYELEALAKNLDKPRQIEHQDADGRSVSVYNTVKNTLIKSDPTKSLAATIMRQDISMGNLLVKAGNLAQFPADNSEDNQDENE